MDNLTNTTSDETTEQAALFNEGSVDDDSVDEPKNTSDGEGAGEASTSDEKAPETVEATTDEATSDATAPEATVEATAEAVEAAPAKPAKPVTRTIPQKRHLRAELPHSEKAKILDEIIDLDEQLKQTEKAKKNAAEKYKDKLDSLNAKRLELTDIAREGRKVDVLCDMTLDYTNETVTVVRRDTQETLESRTMSKDERQGTLEFGSADRTLATVVDLGVAFGTTAAPTVEAPEAVADEWVVRWQDKETGHGGLSQAGSMGPDGLRDRVFLSAFEAEEWCESQRAIYGETTEYVPEPRAIAEAAFVVEGVPVEYVVKVTHDDDTFSYCVNEESALARFASEGAAQIYADEMGAGRANVKYMVEFYVPAPIVSDDDDGTIGVDASELAGIAVDDEAPAPKKKRAKRKTKSHTKARGAKSATVET